MTGDLCGVVVWSPLSSCPHVLLVQIGTTPVCVTMNAVRTGMVAKSKPVAVRVYDYYEPGQCFFSSSGCVSCRVCQGRESWEIPCCYDDVGVMAGNGQNHKWWSC